MRAVLDVTPALAGLTGVARYARSLVAALPSAGVDPQCFAIGRGPGELPPETRHVRVPLRLVDPVWHKVGAPKPEFFFRDADLIHSIDESLPPTRRPLVANLHDTGAIDRPDLHSPHQVERQRKRLDSVAHAQVVIALSHAAAQDLLRHGFDTNSVCVAHLAPADFSEPEIKPADSRPYILAVGELHPRKDYQTLIRALALEPADQLRLVIAGPMGYRGQEVLDLADKLSVSNRVHHLGHVSDAVLAGLYRHASALCMPSVIEGFGLPLVEAMKFGVPIVASDIEVVREVAGEAALKVPVGDPADLAVGLYRSTTDEDLRAAMQAAGRSRIELFTWERTAAATREAYERATA